MGTHRPTFLSAPELRTASVSAHVAVGGMEAVRIAFTGEFGMGTTGTVLAAVRDALETYSPGRLEVDLVDVGFMDASGITTLVRCREQAAAAGCELAVTDAQPIVYELLGITGMLEALTGRPVPAGRGPLATEGVRTVDLGASADGIEQGRAGTPMAAAAPKADQLDTDMADTRMCRRMAGDIREAARQARERAQAMIADDSARRTRMRSVWAAMNDSAPRAR